jgi:hypothetical protein
MKHEVVAACALGLIVIAALMVIFTNRPVEHFEVSRVVEGMRREDEVGGEEEPAPANLAKIGIVSMMRKPKDSQDWLDHHRGLGVARFYIRLEDADESEKAFFKAQADVELEEGASSGVDEYKDIQNRQIKLVDKYLKEAADDGVKWLIHIDADELLEADSLDEIRELPDNVRTFWMENREAVYGDIPRANDKCFNAVSFRNCAENDSGCVSYINGKPGGRTVDDVYCEGPHRLQSRREGAEQRKLETIKVRHYESCDVDMYKQKFRHVAKEVKSDIPFPYYNESVAAAKTGKDEAMEQVFRKYRVAA